MVLVMMKFPCTTLSVSPINLDIFLFWHIESRRVLALLTMQFYGFALHNRRDDVMKRMEPAVCIDIFRRVPPCVPSLLGEPTTVYYDASQ